MNTSASRSSASGEGLVEIDGREYYAIPDVDQMPPFLMNVVSDGDRWMFASSSGALTAGRVDASGAIFPYETDDRLHDAVGKIGPVTAIRIGDRLWRPFGSRGATATGRRLLKSLVGDSLIFEERDPGSGLVFRYRWSSCEEYGFVRTATLTNDSIDTATGSASDAATGSVAVDLVDGVVNVLPFGLDPPTTQRLSNLTSAYKRSELVDADTGLALFSLESPVSDRAEPEEVLRATVAWSTGLEGATICLDADVVRQFERQEDIHAAPLITGRPGAYLLAGSAALRPGESARWEIVLDAARDHRQIAELRSAFGRGDVDLNRAVDAASERLVAIMARADALQCTGDPVATAHHFANVTYNVMRGGVPLDGYRITRDQFVRFVGRRHRGLADRHAEWLAALPETFQRRELQDWARSTGDVHLYRLAREYLPFSFSRRHGDPSRPWNQFSIRVRDAAGEPVVHYEGNWRDVFQNWEALCASHPEYLPDVVAVFANASTADGFNPYRITSDGIDWESPDPDDPWANIGYWGDHQIVYLLRLLDAAERHLPGSIATMLTERSSTFADVPYRLAPYPELLADPKSTITYDDDAAAASAARVERTGGDGRLLVGADGEIVTVSLLEKLVITALARLSNFVPGGGIWMNTQRPEWNDANNALVGYGLSMVTVCHLRAFLGRLQALADRAPGQVACSAEVVRWVHTVTDALRETSVVGDDAPGGAIGDGHRKRIMDALGSAFSEYRAAVYRDGLGDASSMLTAGDVRELCRVALHHVDHTIRDSRRADGLVHSYNLLDLSPDGSRATVRHLPEMLEGQVAVLGAGVLDAAERADLVDALFRSAMYRADRQTFMLYPVRHLPSFLDKNVVPDDAVGRAPLLGALLSADDTSVVVRDAAGTCRFHPDLVDADRLDAALDALGDTWADAVAEQRAAVHDVYESVFAHRSFLGRSGSMYAYEGIGSIYWHMVTKLLLAVQEAAVEAAAERAGADIVGRLVDAYFRVRDGLGYHQTAADFGAVPTDPYSHTPAHAGAQQPGMTGAVKEELLARPLELGLTVADGEIGFDPLLLRDSEVRTHDARWTPIAIDGGRVPIDVPAGSWGFTYCQVPVVATRVDRDPWVEVELGDGSVHRTTGPRLPRSWSAEVFARSGNVVAVRAGL